MGTNFVARQIGRGLRINLAFRDDKRYIGAYQLATTGNITSPTFLYADVQNELDPFDYETFNDSATAMYAVVSDLVFGQPAYLRVSSLPEQTDVLRASASLPMVSRPVAIDGRLYLDGGTTDSVPLEKALEEPGTRRALVILTRERPFVKAPSSLLGVARHLYADYPYYLDALETRAERYNAQRARIAAIERDGTAFVIAPPHPVGVANVEHDGAKLLALYIQGRQAADEAFGAGLAEFLGL